MAEVASKSHGDLEDMGALGKSLVSKAQKSRMNTYPAKPTYVQSSNARNACVVQSGGQSPDGTGAAPGTALACA